MWIPNTKEKKQHQAYVYDAPTTQTRTTDTSIRKWGCDLTETPLIFVHNGKSGGGNIRARLAASALNYKRRQKWQTPHKDEHYYPVPNVNGNGNVNNVSSIRHGKFCNSMYPHYTAMPHITTPIINKNFEGKQNCNATTPLGIAVACPHPYKVSGKLGGIRLDHYQNANCQMCDDEYYLEVDYYNPKFDNSREDQTQTPNNKNNDQRRQRLKRKGETNKKISKGEDTLSSFVPPFSENVLDPRNDPPPGSTCDVVFTAHNNIGSELNWLPPRYLKEHWWDQSEYGRQKSKKNRELEKYWEVLLDDRHRRREKLGEWANANATRNPQTENKTDDSDTNHRWCPHGYKSNDDTTKYDRPSNIKEYKSAYQDCGLPLAEQADRAFLEAFFPSDTTTTTLKNFSPFYASMPLHRVTVMRDPWSWIISKFFWHHLDKETKPEKGTLPCYDVHATTTAKGGSFIPPDPITGRKLGWCEQFSLVFLIKLCGNDCRVRYENGMMILEEIEAQVASNLRNAFSVIGILHETESFYDMLTDRISYVDMALNPNVMGGDHATEKTNENLACKELFGTDETFRESVRKTVPAFAALERMYHLGVEVNAFQKEELRQCKEAKGEQATRGIYDATQ